MLVELLFQIKVKLFRINFFRVLIFGGATKKVNFWKGLLTPSPFLGSAVGLRDLAREKSFRTSSISTSPKSVSFRPTFFLVTG